MDVRLGQMGVDSFILLLTSAMQRVENGCVEVADRGKRVATLGTYNLVISIA